MKIIVILFVVLSAGWLLNFYSEQNGYSLIKAIDTKLGSTKPMKCITKDGDTLYGSLPSGVECESVELVKVRDSLTLYPGENFTVDKSSVSANLAPNKFNCDGRVSCSQMSSCAEAIFFLRNCPNTKMDGDHDGIPCERQWCS